MKQKIETEGKVRGIISSEGIRNQIEREKSKAVCELLLQKGAFL